VVDTDCRVHGKTSLIVAGSSVFSDVGLGQPAPTIVAWRYAWPILKRYPA
jgi:choline dehydrogenase-like flavoprotein